MIRLIVIIYVNSEVIFIMNTTFFERLENKFIPLTVVDGKIPVMAPIHNNTCTIFYMEVPYKIVPEDLKKEHNNHIQQWIETMKTGQKNQYDYDLCFFASMSDFDRIGREILELKPEPQDLIKLYNNGFRQAKNTGSFIKMLSFENRMRVFAQGCDYDQVADKYDEEISSQAEKILSGLLRDLKYAYDEDNDKISKSQWYANVWSHFKHSTGLEHLSEETIVNYLNIYVPSEDGTNSNKRELIRSIITCFKRDEQEAEKDLDESSHVSTIKYRVLDWMTDYDLPVVNALTESINKSMVLLEPGFDRLNINQMSMSEIKNGMATIFIESQNNLPANKQMVQKYLDTMLGSIPHETRLTVSDIQRYWKEYVPTDAGKVLTYCLLQEETSENEHKTEYRLKI